MDSPLLKEQEAADLLRMKVATLRSWRVRGGGPTFIKVGGSVRYRPADIDAWLESRSRK